MPMPRVKVVQGIARDFTYQTPNGDGTFGAGFVSTDAITSTVWVGDSQSSVATPTVVWGSSQVLPAAGASTTLWTVQFNETDTASLTPGLYRLQVFATHATRTACLFDGLLELLDTPGSGTDGDLCSYTYVETMLAPLRLSSDERNMLSYLKQECSAEIRKWCGQRDFNQQSYVEEYIADLNGFVALNQMPVNAVTRVRGYPQTALSISAAPSVFQEAWVTPLYTGDWASGLVYTGISLNSIASAVPSSTTLLFASYPTVGALATAVSAVSGWRGLTSGNFSQWQSADLMSYGSAQGAMDDGGCQLRVYAEDLACTRLDNATGMFYVGRHRINSTISQSWGPDYPLIEDLEAPEIGRVQVSYNAGFITVPLPVQLACVELVKASIERLRRNSILRSEDDGRYKYTMDLATVADLPYSTQCRLAKWRMWKAR
jgi:hypothetical protein